MVDYEERFYAAGRIKGSRFIKKEGRPSDEAVLTGRMVDRSIRPLFPQSMRNDIQVVLTVLSFDNENDPDIVSLIAASCALAISDVPWHGPIAGIRVGHINGEWVANGSYEARAKSDFDLTLAGNGESVIMIEAGGKEISEEVMLQAMEFGKKHTKPVVAFIKDIQVKAGAVKQSWPEAEAIDTTVAELVRALVPRFFLPLP